MCSETAGLRENLNIRLYPQVLIFSFPIEDDPQNSLTAKLMELVVQQQEQIARQQELIIQRQEQAVQQKERIEAVIIRLKTLNPEPDIKPGAEPSTEDIPPGSIRHGHTPFDVQDLDIKTSTIRYLQEQLLLMGKQSRLALRNHCMVITSVKQTTLAQDTRGKMVSALILVMSYLPGMAAPIARVA